MLEEKRRIVKQVWTLLLLVDITQPMVPRPTFANDLASKAKEIKGLEVNVNHSPEYYERKRLYKGLEKSAGYRELLARRVDLFLQMPDSERQTASAKNG